MENNLAIHQDCIEVLRNTNGSKMKVIYYSMLMTCNSGLGLKFIVSMKLIPVAWHV